PDLKSNTSGPENRANKLVWRAVASKVLDWNPNGEPGTRKNGVPGATGVCVLYRKSATTAPPRTSWKSPSPVVTVRFLPSASTCLASSSSVGGAFGAGGAQAGGGGKGAVRRRGAGGL